MGKHSSEPGILCFNKYGLLPPGDYSMTFFTLRNSVVVCGPPRPGGAWDQNWRSQLVSNLEILVTHLWSVGITEIYIDGSFVEDKAHPGDIDGYFECDEMTFLKIKKDLLGMDSCWSWRRYRSKSGIGSVVSKTPMWHRYKVELYPHYGQFCGIRDEFGHVMKFPAAFRKTRYHPVKEKGIIKIIKEV